MPMAIITIKPEIMMDTKPQINDEQDKIVNPVHRMSRPTGQIDLMASNWLWNWLWSINLKRRWSPSGSSHHPRYWVDINTNRFIIMFKPCSRAYHRISLQTMFISNCTSHLGASPPEHFPFKQLAAFLHFNTVYSSPSPHHITVGKKGRRGEGLLSFF